MPLAFSNQKSKICCRIRRHTSLKLKTGFSALKDNFTLLSLESHSRNLQQPKSRHQDKFPLGSPARHIPVIANRHPLSVTRKNYGRHCNYENYECCNRALISHIIKKDRLSGVFEDPSSGWQPPSNLVSRSLPCPPNPPGRPGVRARVA